MYKTYFDKVENVQEKNNLKKSECQWEESRSLETILHKIKLQGWKDKVQETSRK